jgi:hypothetical protein
MSDGKNALRGSKKIRASIDLRHRVLDGEHAYGLPLSIGAAGPCDGKPDGASCGSGCTCVSGQPWYSLEAITKLGIRPINEDR